LAASPGQGQRTDDRWFDRRENALICTGATYCLVVTGVTTRSGRRESNSRYQLGKLMVMGDGRCGRTAVSRCSKYL